MMAVVNNRIHKLLRNRHKLHFSKKFKVKNRIFVHFSTTIFCLKFACGYDAGIEKTVRDGDKTCEDGVGMGTRSAGMGWWIWTVFWGWGRTAVPVQLSSTDQVYYQFLKWRTIVRSRTGSDYFV